MRRFKLVVSTRHAGSYSHGRFATREAAEAKGAELLNDRWYTGFDVVEAVPTPKDRLKRIAELAGSEEFEPRETLQRILSIATTGVESA